MTPELQAAFRKQLAGVIAGLQVNYQDPAMRAVIGTAGLSLVTETGARDWADLKARADGPTYDKVLKALQENAQARQAKGDQKSKHAFEVLATSMIARRQSDADLGEAIDNIDLYVADCIQGAREAGASRDATTTD